MNIVKISKDNYNRVISQAATVISEGGLIVSPFDTVYGFACDPFNDKVLEKLFNLKKRSKNKVIGLATTDLDKIQKISELSAASKQFIKERIPGNFTFIINLKKPGNFSKYCVKNNTVGIRIPDSKLVLDFTSETNGYIAQTSANKSGCKVTYSIDELASQFSTEEFSQIDLILDGGTLSRTNPSTIIDLTGNHPKEIERN